MMYTSNLGLYMPMDLNWTDIAQIKELANTRYKSEYEDLFGAEGHPIISRDQVRHVLMAFESIQLLEEGSSDDLFNGA